jgi:hypothetical protein
MRIIIKQVIIMIINSNIENGNENLCDAGYSEVYE